MSQKNEARKKYLQVKTRTNRKLYEVKRTEANRICREREKKKKNLDKQQN